MLETNKLTLSNIEPKCPSRFSGAPFVIRCDKPIGHKGIHVGRVNWKE